MPPSPAGLRSKTNVNGSRRIGCEPVGWGTGRPLMV